VIPPRRQAAARGRDHCRQRGSDVLDGACDRLAPDLETNPQDEDHDAGRGNDGRGYKTPGRVKGGAPGTDKRRGTDADIGLHLVQMRCRRTSTVAVSAIGVA